MTYEFVRSPFTIEKNTKEALKHFSHVSRIDQSHVVNVLLKQFLTGKIHIDLIPRVNTWRKPK